MKKNILFLFTLSVLLLFTACQKEYSLELSGTVSTGSLQSDVTGECLPKTVQGIYEAGNSLDPDSNYIDIQVNVTGAGSYSISSDTVNGMFFQAKGSFSTAGLNDVRLKGTGTPLAAGISSFTISYDSTECVVAVPTLVQGGAVDAEFTLAGAPDTCMNYVLAGNYVTGIATTAANTVTISVNVTVPGIYNIATEPSNGLTFSGSGSLANTGVQTITLTASGTPGVADSTSIPVEFGVSSCNFIVDITATAPVGGDYFPRTTNSNWSYEIDDDPVDSVFIRVLPDTKTILGNVFNVFMFTPDANSGFDSSGYYRKAGGEYYQFLDIGELYGLDSTYWGELLFLKDDVAVGSSWQTPGFTGTTGGQAITFRFNYKISEKNVNVLVNGTNYPNTIVVDQRVEIFVAGTWQDATSAIGYFKSYYALGVGLIREEALDPAGTVESQYELRRHQVF